MRASLASWVSDADARRHLERFAILEIPLRLSYHRPRAGDYYLSLVGELFERMRDGYAEADDWARLGNGLAQYGAADREGELQALGVNADQAILFAAAAFYFGGFPASAFVTMRTRVPTTEDQTLRACFELLAHPPDIRSETTRDLVQALREGSLQRIEDVQSRVASAASAALLLGPDEWVPLKLLEEILARFRITNIRAALPDGTSDFWDPLVKSWLDRRPPVWEFFPSQKDALDRGLLQRPETFSLQMPTGAGKTAICETLLYWHLRQAPDRVAIVLVPYRSLASELRGTLVKRLNAMQISASCAYGGTVPSGDEIQQLDETSALIATPETLSGLLSANAAFSQRISLVICDEGHLLDGGSRGVSLELLLARLKAREIGAPRFVFLSAIVPNIEEINSWLGGTDNSVVRSEYRPGLAEFAVLRPNGPGASVPIAMEMHPHQAEPIRFKIERFLTREDFGWLNEASGQVKTFPFSSIKTRAIATARKALPRGGVVVFAANKRGNQGAIGLAEELLKQLQHPLRLPEPMAFANRERVGLSTEYLQLEYGAQWVGTRALLAGAVLHHGDIPQETREVLEALLRTRSVSLGICTSTLAEGVNLPIRTLVLYSVQRRERAGPPVDLLIRDIKNLVGRAGRPGETTKGLVICANPQQWHLVQPVAERAAGEPVVGALRLLVQNVRRQIAARNITLTNPLLERSPALQSLVDGIDATLVDLAAAELGEDELIGLAMKIANETFAARQVDDASKKVLQDVFELRARRITAIHSAGRLDWLRETGARARLLDTVESGLLPRRPTWDDVVDPIDAGLVTIMLDWAWTQLDLQRAVREAYRLPDDADVASVQQSFYECVRLWLSGNTFIEMSARAELSVDDTLGLHSTAITFILQTIVEQGVALLSKLLEAQARELATAVAQFPNHLRFGVPTRAGHALAAGGVSHRRASVAIGGEPEMSDFSADDRIGVFLAAQALLLSDSDGWRGRLGNLVMNNTLRDLSAAREECTDATRAVPKRLIAH